MKLRTGDPWIPAADYGRLLPQFMINLVVRDLAQSLTFYREVLLAEVHYADADFAAVRVLAAEIMLHADHTYDRNPWYPALVGGELRGLGAEIRLFGMDPDELCARAAAQDCLVRETMARGHGWREAMVRDPDGYVWAVGVATNA